jgi:hypothetical protein
MQLAGYELKKIFIKHKGGLFLLIFLVIKIFSLLLFDRPVNSEIQEELTGYSYYLNKIEGIITEEKIEYLEVEAESLTNATSLIQQLNNDYYDGFIVRDEYETKIKTLQDVIIHKKGFDVLYSQYTYASEKPENRYILNTNGWDGLLSKEKLDWILYLLIFLIITPIVCEEYSNDMNVIILTQKNGGRCTTYYKIMISIILAFILTFINSMIEYIFYLIKYGLNHGEFPLQSLSYFSSAEKSISLLETFAYITCLKLIGAISLSIIILFVSVYVKKYALTLLMSSSLLIVPFYMFSVQFFKYYIPGPLSFLIATGFFRGNEYKTNTFTGEVIVIFREIPMFILLFLIVIISIICIIMILFILKINTNNWYKRRLK